MITLVGGELDASTAWSIFNGVIQQVRHDLTRAIRVDREKDIFWSSYAKPNTLLVSDVFVEFNRFLDKARDIYLFKLKFHRPCLGLRNIHKRVEHCEDTVGLFHAISQRFLRVFEILS